MLDMAQNSHEIDREATKMQANALPGEGIPLKTRAVKLTSKP